MIYDTLLLEDWLLCGRLSEYSLITRASGSWVDPTPNWFELCKNSQASLSFLAYRHLFLSLTGFFLDLLVGLLPKADKAVDHLKKFFNAVHLDRSLRNSVCQLFHLKCSSKIAAQCMVSL